MISLDKLLQKSENINKTILAFDPGETVGWAVYTNNDFTRNQIQTKNKTTKTFEPKAIQFLESLFTHYKPDHIVFETYQIYDWKTKDHSFSEVYTAQIIGVIKYLALKHELPIFGQTAQIAKQFCTDEKLKAWRLYSTKLKHSNDAIRHLLYHLIFHKTIK